MELEKTNISGLFVLKAVVRKDDRGIFLKTYEHNFYNDNQLRSDFKEFYYSTSGINVIRGLHFQIPPEDHAKLVYVSFGRIMDIALDLRKTSPTFGQLFSTELNSKNGKILYLPSGIAHGFKSLEERTIVNYAQTSSYSKEHDQGVLYSSIPFDWGIENLIVSDRDLSFPSLKLFNETNPFQ
jgi:dTDP-4-dehydrorhamnose 3,5-epimerase